MKYAPKIEQNISKFYLCAFFDNWAFATGILVFHYRELGFSFFQIFLISVVYEFLNFILEIPTGALADLWSYKKTITIGYFISGMSFFIVLIRPEAYLTYLVWAVLSAICTTLNSGSVSAFIYETMQVIDVNRYPQVLSRISAISLITRAVSMVIGGILADHIGFNAALLISGIGGLLQTAVHATTVEPARRKVVQFLEGSQPIFQRFITQIKNSFSILFKNEKVRFLLIYGIMYFVIAEFTAVIFQPYLAELGFSTKSQVALFSAGSLFLMAASAMLCGRNKTRRNEVKLLIGTSAGLCLGLVLIFLPKLGIPAFILLYACIGAVEIILADMLNRFIPSENRATVLSAQNQLSSLSYACAALLLGAAMDSLGIKLSALITGILLAIEFSVLFAHNSFKELASTNT